MVRRHLATGHGLSVDEYRARWNQREEDLFDRLSNHSPDHLAGDLVKDVDAAVGFINSRYCAEHEFSATAQKYQLIIKALSADGDSAAVRQARAEVQIDLLVTLISSGDYSLGLRPRGAMLARMCGRVRLSSYVSEISSSSRSRLIGRPRTSRPVGTWRQPTRSPWTSSANAMPTAAPSS